MSKYSRLGEFLRSQRTKEVPMTFAEIERVTGARLPANSPQYPAWWSNNPSNNVMTKIWLAAGFRQWALQQPAQAFPVLDSIADPAVRDTVTRAAVQGAAADGIGRPSFKRRAGASDGRR